MLMMIVKDSDVDAGMTLVILMTTMSMMINSRGNKKSW